MLAVVFVLQNAQPVRVHFWFVRAHPRLIWVVLVSVVVGVVLGYLLAAPGRRAAKRRRRQERAEQREARRSGR